jgi:hypothetical protein
MKVSRVREPGLVPLEIWNRPVRGGLLYEHPEELWGAIRGIEFDSVFLGGGRTVPIPRLPYRVEVSPDGAFVGEKGGLALLKGRGAVIDVGQSAIKVSWNGTRRTIPRPSGLGSGGRLREFLASAIPAAPAFVIALPCEIDDAGIPGACTYGWEGDATLVADAMRLAGADGDVFLLNDAELAALSCPKIGERTLVVTIGYAVGACLRT